jgi:hypothetical protein
MKNATLILALLSALVACKRSVRDSGCISRYDGPSGNYPSLKAGQLDTIKSLFNANGLSLANLNFVYYYSDTAKDTTNIPYFNQQVSATLSVNGLPIFYATMGWYFHNGVLFQSNSSSLNYPNPGSDTTAHQTLPALRSLFFKTYEAALYTSNGPNLPAPTASPRLGRPGEYYRDSCLIAQLGYIDASWQPNSGASYGKKLLKVWQIYPEHVIPMPLQYRPLSPIVFVIDETGFAWCQAPLYPGDPILFTD